MQRFFTVLTLTCLMLTFFVSEVTYANTDENGSVDIAEKNEETDKRNTNTAFDILRNSNILYLLAKGEYDNNAAKIERGVAVTASKLLALTATVFSGGTLTPPVAVSTLVDMVGLAESIDKSTPLLSAYEATISNKQSSIGSFELTKMGYVRTYDTLVGVLATHTGWSKYNLLIHISDDANRRNGIIHKGISGSGKHGLVGKKIWGAYDKSLPSYTCKGPCSDTFITPTLAKTSHRVKCGTAYSVWDNEWEVPTIMAELRRRNVDQGCGQSWYKCPSYPTIDASNADDLHKVRKCNKWVYTYDSHFSNRYTRTKCPKSYRKCMGHTYDHNNRVIGKSAHSDEGGSDPPPVVNPPPSPPSMHPCGVHETSVSGSHSAAGCGTSGHYVCDGSSHASAGCGKSGHYACDSKTHTAAVCGTSGHYDCDKKNHSMQVTCTTHSSCEVTNFYACDDHDPSATCAAGHTYDPTRAKQVNTHRTRTCRFSNCGQTWQKCVSSAPICNKPYRKKNGLRCQPSD